MFYKIKWLPQMMHILNSKESIYFKPIFLSITEKYPQSIVYHFNVIFNSIYSFEKNEICSTISDILYDKFPIFDEFVTALNQLTHPEHRLLFYLDLIKQTFILEKEPEILQSKVNFFSLFFSLNQLLFF